MRQTLHKWMEIWHQALQSCNQPCNQPCLVIVACYCRSPSMLTVSTCQGQSWRSCSFLLHSLLEPWDHLLWLLHTQTSLEEPSSWNTYRIQEEGCEAQSSEMVLGMVHLEFPGSGKSSLISAMLFRGLSVTMKRSITYVTSIVCM